MPRIGNISLPNLPLINYSLLFFVMGLGDAIMSYFTPVYLEEKLGTPLLMGIVFSTSSMAGFVSDVILGEWLRGKPFSYFIRVATIGALVLPLAYIVFPQYLPFFILTMVMWGLYYEFANFSNFHFINVHMSKNQHELGWGVLQTFKSLAYMVGPIIASYLLIIGNRALLAAVCVIQVIAIIGFEVFIHFQKHTPHQKEKPTTKETPRSLIHLLHVWKVLAQKTWPILALLFIMGLLDATFWTVGAVLSERLKQQDFIGSLLIVAYLIPSLCMGLISARVSKPFGKKKAAFISAIVGGIILIFAGLTKDIRLFITLITASSLFTAIAWPELLGTFEDYVSRLGKAGNAMVGLTSSMMSLAYVIGPITAGVAATLLGEQQTFSVMGALMGITGCLALLIVPRKVHLPQQQIEALH